MKLRVSGCADDSIVDGPGIRFVVFTQGCPHRCAGCHNPHTHDFNGGYEADTADLIEKIKINPLLDGLTLSGGEPFAQPGACAELADRKSVV
jgi:anaerobic ribonucleoside-triphosphate reductase activating protein